MSKGTIQVGDGLVGPALEREALPWAKLLYNPPGHGEVMEDFLPQQGIVESYATQWYRVQIGAQEYAIRPKNLADNPYKNFWAVEVAESDEPDLLSEAFVIGYLNPDGIPSTFEERASRKEAAKTLIEAAGFEAIDIVAIHRDSRWVEAMFLVPGVPAEEAWRVAREFGQDLIVSFANGRQRIQQVTGAKRFGGYEYEVLPLDQAPCPMSLGYETTHSPERAGGPHGSRAMSVAAQWQVHFFDTHSLLKCSPCASRSPEKSGPISLVKWAPASRFKYIHDPEFTYEQDQRILRRFEEGTPSSRSVSGRS